MRTIGIIPARGGSKSIPRKNIRLLGGKPLLQYTADAALRAQRLYRVILSTDDEEIADLGKQFGLEVPFLRPMELAQDTTPTLPVIQHAVQFLKKQGDWFDAVCLLQPTNPFRSSDVIDACIEILEKRNADTVVTILPVPLEYNPHWVYFEQENGFLHLSTGEEVPIARRQDLPPAFHREGSVYVTRCDIIMEQGILYGKHMIGYLMDPKHSVNIDSTADWERAESLLPVEKQ